MTHQATNGQQGTVTVCPRCQGQHAYRSRRSFIEKFFTFFLSLRPYRCVVCDCRFWRFQ
jgi:hypothetical protein